MPAAEISVSVITDHRFVAEMTRPWGLCQVPGCNLGEAAHRRSLGIYTPTATSKRCPACVQTDAEWCPHA